ncbi:MAG: peptide chain release factor-like protein [Kiritimatiellae bacterium]|nr:peptide chain release factor-like protein [Kiritimatiellia bacterium]MDD5521549.1 peptide chain release factor-like protein [Kiritimatiellia bacterium]
MPEGFVSSSKTSALAGRMIKLGVRECDLIEKFVLGSGKGGQKLNKTSSCVYIRHVPTGIEVKCQQERSRSLNRFLARRELCDRIEERILGEKSMRRQEWEKIRRQKRRRSRRQKEKMLAAKHHHAKKKEFRRSVNADAD